MLFIFSFGGGRLIDVDFFELFFKPFEEEGGVLKMTRSKMNMAKENPTFST